HSPISPLFPYTTLFRSHDVLRRVEWPTLVFFMGLFVMVAGLSHTGVIETAGRWVVELVGDNYFAAASSLLYGSAVLGAFFDNIRSEEHTSELQSRENLV